ncbi:MAG: DUF5666 domain-containing protein [Gammaproteobacteria bacterium]
MNKVQQFSLTVMAAALMTACGGGGSSSDGGVEVVNGGIGGSGSGTVTGFGSIIINDIREFEFDDDSRVRIDGDDATENQLKAGMVVSVTVDDDVNDDFTRGTLETVDAHHEVKGIITALNPLRVLAQQISVVSATVLDDVPGNDLANLDVGDEVEISGHRDENGVIRASLIEYKPAGVDVWQLRGTVTATPSGVLFNIGSQPVNTSSATVQNCSGGISIGDTVAVKFNPVSSLANGQTLNATRVECYTPGLTLPDDSSSLKSSFEGFIDSITNATRFTLNGQVVQLSGSVVYENGSSDDLVVGAKVEAEGVLDSSTGILTAVKLRFREAEFRIEAPVAPGAVVAGESVTLFGVTVYSLAVTEDDDDVFGGLSSSAQIEVRGFVDSDGTAYAEEIRDRGTPDAGDTLVRGPVSAKSAGGFTLLGMDVDTGGALLLDRFGNSVSEAVFLQQLRIGQQVKVSDASYNSGSNTISGGQIELED